MGVKQTITHAPEVAGSVPAVRVDDGNTYIARLFYDAAVLRNGEQYFRFRSDGPDLANQIIARTPLLPSGWEIGQQPAGPGVLSNPYEAVLIARIDQLIGVGTISANFPDRIFRFPFILRDPDLDFTAGKIRVRGAVGIGTGKNMVLITLGQFEALFTVTPVNYEASSSASSTASSGSQSPTARSTCCRGPIWATCHGGSMRRSPACGWLSA